MYLNDVPKYFQFSINFNNIVSICVQFSILKKMWGWRAPLQCPPMYSGGPANNSGVNYLPRTSWLNLITSQDHSQEMIEIR